MHVKYYDPFTKTQLMEKYYTIPNSNKVQGEYKNWASNGKLHKWNLQWNIKNI